MASVKKPEINLEICSGFFRIPTEEAIYNITVLESSGGSATRIVEKIVEVEKAAETAPQGEAAPALGIAPGVELGDDFYKQLSQDVFQDIGQLAKSLSSTIMDLPAEDRRGKRVELDEAGEKIEHAKRQLQDIVDLTEKATMEIMDHVEQVQSQTDGVQDLLSMLKDHAAFKVTEGGEEGVEETAGVALEEYGEKRQALEDNVVKALELVAALREEQAAAPPSAPPEPVAAPAATRVRYLFDIDVVFQTLYELCTNETVKTHITSAREAAATIFDRDSFLDLLTDKVSSMEPDGDNFFNVPMTDVFSSLLTSCSDEKIQNLLKRMDQNQSSIFLDQFLPLEAPATEEVEAEGEAEAVPVAETPVETEGVENPRLAELDALLAASRELAVDLAQPVAGTGGGGVGGMSKEDQTEIFSKIESAFELSSNICADISRITEVLSFQDLSGQQILKIIKLLSDFQIQLLGIVVSFGSQLKHKEEAKSLTVEETKKLAQEDVDSYLKSLTTDEVGGEGSLDQDSINKMLEDMGF